MQRSRCKNSLLDEHWKRKQRLKVRTTKLDECQMKTRISKKTSNEFLKLKERLLRRIAMSIDVMRPPFAERAYEFDNISMRNQMKKATASGREATMRKFIKRPTGASPFVFLTRCLCRLIRADSLITLILFACYLEGSQVVIGASSSGNGRTSQSVHATSSQPQTPGDPRPTIYSGQVSFGLLLSAHSSLGAELTTSASNQRSALMALVSPPIDEEAQDGLNSTHNVMITTVPSPSTLGTMGSDKNIKTLQLEASNATSNSLMFNEPLATSESVVESLTLMNKNQSKSQSGTHQLRKRQIFEQRQKNNQRSQNPSTDSGAQQGGSKLSRQLFETSATCSQINANALYAGMGAIWASHQANLVGDSQLTIGTYVYDSCNDLDLGQRQSVRIVSNLNAFQQTTCEAPRGSPISLTIAHGDNQLKAIQLLTSFRVPVVTTKEPFELEDYNQLSHEQRRFLFSTAHSSRHLATGALRFTKRIVSRLSSSPKLPNQYHKMSSKNGLIVISQNLPSKFISYLTDMIPKHVNYEMLQTHRPIDQIRSVEALEYILMRSSASVASSAESRVSQVAVKRQKRYVSPIDSLASSINDDSEGSAADSISNQEEDQTKILSPTILMFITPSEAIDLVTRLRNDLAEVSRYYSLIVTTREDISPALQTIFHRGGSRLCSGKAFYTISPKPDDIGEFSRYFRDTIQMEGENSDHPLICEYAKYRSMTRTSSELDDIGTEPVIKAVWAAASAFKAVFRKECGSSSGNQISGSNVYRSQSDSSSESATAATNGRVLNSRQSTSKTSECMVKMNKNLSNFVQRALKRLDVTINSTGLQALDGFRIKFDDMNELTTNEFSIKYINKECDLTELGQYSGLDSSSLKLDEETLVKSLESIIPDPWPVKPVASLAHPQSTVTTMDTSQKQDESPSNEMPSSVTKTNPSSDANSSTSSEQDSTDTSTSRNENGRRYSAATGEDPPATHSEEEDGGANIGPVERGGTGSESTNTETPVPLITTSSKDRSNKQTLGSNRLAVRKKHATGGSSHSTHIRQQQPITASGRGLASGATESDVIAKQLFSSRGLKLRNNTLGELSSLVHSTKHMRELKPFPAQSVGTTLEEWIPFKDGDLSTTTTRQPTTTVRTYPTITSTNRLHDGDDERVDPGQPSDLKQKGTTQAPVVYTTLPESDGNTNLDLHPPTKTSRRHHPKYPGRRSNLETSATTESSDYITAASLATIRTGGSSMSPAIPLGELGLLVNNPLNNQSYRTVSTSGIDIVSDYRSSPPSSTPTKLSYLSNDYQTSPLPSSTPSTMANNREPGVINGLKPARAALQDSDPPINFRGNKSKSRSNLHWIYNSWFGLTILAGNICGALVTLYILTFLLLKNCNGSLDRENQGIRSMHLLAIIVVFFGSTLYIVYPTPGLCLLRTSWQNFALVLLFGSLLLQAMQARSMRTLGLGGRPNRLNQFLTLVFMVGVQVSFELQRWKYESSNYLKFVHQHFGSGTNEIDRKLSMLTNSITSQFDPMNSFNDQVTPISIQISEQYQSLLSDYCTQKSDDYLQSQIYLFILILLLLIFSASTRKSNRLLSSGHHQSGKSFGSRRKLTSSALGTASGNLVASQHEANLTTSHFESPFASTQPINGPNSLGTGNVFAVSMVCILIYMISAFLHISGYSSINQDLVPSVTMVMIAFSALIGIFLPVLRQINRYDDLVDSSLPGGSAMSSGTVTGNNRAMQKGGADSSPTSTSAAFTMFPEFAPTGLRRPSSTSGDSGSGGAGSRRPFAETKESRRNMGTMLANLGPSADSLRSMGFYDDRRATEDNETEIKPGILNSKLYLRTLENTSAPCESLLAPDQQGQQAARRLSKGEKRLIMLDVDPCCPRHGVAAWPRGEEATSKGCRSRGSHPHQ